MIEVKKKKGESDERLIRRLRKRVLMSRLLPRAKASAFFHKEPNKAKVKANRIYGLKKRSLMEHLRKIGKISDNN